jgi:hypothetical protein
MAQVFRYTPYAQTILYTGKFVSLLTVHGDRCTAGCEADTNFVGESICLLADNFRNEVVTIHRSQEEFKMLSLYTWTFLALAKMFCRNICKFPMNIGGTR